MKASAISRLLLAIIVFAHSAAFATATQKDVDDLQMKIEQAQYEVTELLHSKGFSIQTDKNYEMSGSISGTINGQMVQHSPGTMGILGTALGISIGALLGGPVGAAAGAVFGPAVGIATSQVTSLGGKGQVSGSLNGQVSGSGWDNLKADQYFGLIVIDDAQAETILAQLDRTNECAQEYATSIRKLLDGKKYITVSEGNALVQKLSSMREQTNDLRKMQYGQSLQLQSLLVQKIASYQSWLDKKISLLQINAQDLALNKIDVKRARLYTRGIFDDDGRADSYNIEGMLERQGGYVEAATRGDKQFPTRPSELIIGFNFAKSDSDDSIVQSVVEKLSSNDVEPVMSGSRAHAKISATQSPDGKFWITNDKYLGNGVVGVSIERFKQTQLVIPTSKLQMTPVRDFNGHPTNTVALAATVSCHKFKNQIGGLKFLVDTAKSWDVYFSDVTPDNITFKSSKITTVVNGQAI